MIGRLIKILMLLIMLSVPAANAGAAADGVNIKVIVTTDLHAAVAYDQRKKQPGLARLKTYVNSLADNGYQVFLLDSGDVFSGGVYGEIDHGRSMAGLMGRMGYRALTPGNHAFDFNEAEDNPLYYTEVLLKMLRDRNSGPLDVTAVNLGYNGGALAGIEREAVIIWDESGFWTDGLRLIVAGVANPYTARASLERGLDGYDFGRAAPGPEEAESTKKNLLMSLSEKIKPFDRPNDIVIVLSHLGWTDPAASGGRIGGPDLAEAANVDFIADGHSHQPVAPLVLGTAVYGNGGRHLTNFLEITIEDGRAEMTLKHFDDLAGLKPDPDIESLIEDLNGRFELRRPLFSLPESYDFSDRDIRKKSTALGRFLCRAMTEAAGADFAFHGSGAIRSGLFNGEVTVGDFYDAVPFTTDLFKVRVSGRDLRDLMESNFSPGRVYFQFYGLKVYGWLDEEGRFHVAGLADLDGRAINPKAYYSAAVNGFMMRGGRNSSLFRKQEQPENLGNLRQAVLRVLSSGEEPDLKSVENVLTFESPAQAEEAFISDTARPSDFPDQQGDSGLHRIMDQPADSHFLQLF